MDFASIVDLVPPRVCLAEAFGAFRGRRAPRLNETYPAQITSGNAKSRCVDQGPKTAAAAISSPAAILIPVRIKPMPRSIANVPTSHWTKGDKAPFATGFPRCGIIRTARAISP